MRVLRGRGAGASRDFSRACDLIEARLNEPLARPSNWRDSRPMVVDDHQALMHNLRGMARMLLNGESRLLALCAVNGLGVAGKSLLTTLA